MAIKFLDLHQSLYLGNVDNQYQKDGLGVFCKKDNLKEYFIGEFVGDEQTGLLFESKGGYNYTLSTRANNFVHNGPSIVRWKNAIEFTRFYNGVKSGKSFVIFDEGEIQLDYFSRDKEIKTHTLEKIKTSRLVNFSGTGLVDFTNVTVSSEDDNEIKLSNGIEIINNKHISIPRSNSKQRLLVKTDENQTISLRNEDSEYKYFPAIKVYKNNNVNSKLVVETRNFDTNFYWDFEYTGNALFIKEFNSEGKFLMKYNINELLLLETNVDIGGAVSYSELLKLMSASKMKKRKDYYFGQVLNNKPHGLGIVSTKEDSDTYYLGNYVNGVQKGPLVLKEKKRYVYCANALNNVLNGPSIIFYNDAVEFAVYKENTVVGPSYLFFKNGNIGIEDVNRSGEREYQLFENIKHNLNFEFDIPNKIDVDITVNKSEYKDEVVYAEELRPSISDQMLPSGLAVVKDDDESAIGIYNGNGQFYMSLVRKSENYGYFLYNERGQDLLRRPYLVAYEDIYSNYSYTPEIDFNTINEKQDLQYSIEFDYEADLIIRVYKNDTLEHLTNFRLEDLVDKGEVIIGENDIARLGSETSLAESDKPTVVTDEKGLALDDLVGLTHIKTQVKRFNAAVIKNKNKRLNMHMVFTGNPGTGKTEVARIIAQTLYEAGILPTNKVIETDRSGLIAEYVGQTALKTHAVIDRAMGGVLFIDEAYSLFSGSNTDFGAEAVEALLVRMENDRGKFIVIMAGYEQEMMQLIRSNPGLMSRIQYEFKFEDYKKDELLEISKIFLKKDGYEMAEDALKLMIDTIDELRTLPHFANAREVRKFIEGVMPIQNYRTREDLHNYTISLEDVLTYISEQKYRFEKINYKEELYIPTKEEMLKLYENVDTVDFSNNVNNIKNRVIALFNPISKSESTGFIIDNRGYGVTCEHSVSGTNRLKAKISLNLAGKTFELDTFIDVLKVDTVNDVALFKIDSNTNDYFHFNLAKDNSEVTTPILLPGYIWGYSYLPTITIYEGKIVNRSKELSFTDIMGKHGQSGSPVIDQTTNEVIGVFRGSNTRGIEEINYFTPINFVWDLFNKE